MADNRNRKLGTFGLPELGNFELPFTPLTEAANALPGHKQRGSPNKRSKLAASFAAALEMARRGEVEMRQSEGIPEVRSVCLSDP